MFLLGRGALFHKIIFWWGGLFCLLASLGSAWDSPGLRLTQRLFSKKCFCLGLKNVSKVRHGIVIENVSAAACNCFIKVISFDKTWHHTPFCKDFADQRTRSILPFNLFLWRYFLHNRTTEALLPIHPGYRPTLSPTFLFVIRDTVPQTGRGFFGKLFHKPICS